MVTRKMFRDRYPLRISTCDSARPIHLSPRRLVVGELSSVTKQQIDQVEEIFRLHPNFARARCVQLLGHMVRSILEHADENNSMKTLSQKRQPAIICINTRTGKGGGLILPSPHVFCEYLSKYSFDRRDFFNTCPKIYGAPFGAKIEDASFFGSLFLSPKVSTFVFRRADAMMGVSWRPPAPAGWARPVAGGGVPAERLGGGGARSRSRIAGSGGRASLRPAATGRVADGGGPMKTNEGPGSIYLHVRHIALKIKMRVCKYYYSNYLLEWNVDKLFIENLGSQKCGRHLFTSRPKLLTLGQILWHYAGRALQELSHVCFGFILAIIGIALDRSKWRSVISPKISIFFKFDPIWPLKYWPKVTKIAHHKVHWHVF